MVIPTATLAQELRDLARKRQLSNRKKELESLADALERKNNDLERWAGTDLFEAFSPEETIATPTFRTIGAILDIITQLLFFVPIFLTWFGLLEAVRTYRKLLGVKSIASQSFLEGWQSGFNHHLSHAWYLDQVALHVVQALVVLGAAILVQFAYRSVAEDFMAARLSRKLSQALTAVNLEVAPYRMTAPNQVATELQKAAAEFNKTAVAVKDVGETAGKTQAAATSSLTKATAALASADTLAKAVAAAAGEVGKTSSSLDTRLVDMNSSITKLNTAETDLAQKISASGTQLSGSVNGLTTRIGDAIKQNQKQMASAANDSAAKIAAALGAGAGQVRTALSAVSLAGNAYAHRVEQAGDLIGKAGDSVNKMPGLVGDFNRMVNDLNARIADLERAITAAKAVIPSATAIPAGLPQTAADLKQAVGTLQSAVGDLKTAATALQSASGGLQSASGGLQSASGGLQSASGGLQTASKGLQTATNGLHKLNSRRSTSADSRRDAPVGALVQVTSAALRQDDAPHAHPQQAPDLPYSERETDGARPDTQPPVADPAPPPRRRRLPRPRLPRRSKGQVR